MKMLPEKREYKIIVVGGSAGSFSVIRKILSELPADFSIPLVLCLHRLKEYRNGFIESLNMVSKIKVTEPLDKDPIRTGKAYLCPANYHLLIEKSRTFALSTEEEVNFSRPSIDLTFGSAGESYRHHMLGILLSGANKDGGNGLYLSKTNGAFTIVQDPEDALFDTMPSGAIKRFNPDRILSALQIIGYLQSLSGTTSGKQYL